MRDRLIELISTKEIQFIIGMGILVLIGIASHN